MRRSINRNDSMQRIQHECISYHIISHHPVYRESWQMNQRHSTYISQMYRIINMLHVYIIMMNMYFNHVQCSRRFRLVPFTLSSYQPTVFRNFLLPVFSDPLPGEKSKDILPLLQGQQRADHAMSGSYLSQHAMKGHLRP